VAAAVALPVFALAFVCAAVLVWRRPLAALYAFVVGLALHNLVMALLYGAGVHGNALEAIGAWKEGLLAVALLRVARDSWGARRLPFRPGLVDALALAFGAIVVLYALIPQSALGGGAGTKAVLYGLRHDLVPIAAFFLGRSLVLAGRELRRLAWTILGVAAAAGAYGLLDDYLVSLDWWGRSGARGYFHEQLGFDYNGPRGLPENFAFNTSDGLFRRLVSTFLSPLATGYLLVVALLLAPLRRWAVPLAAVAGAGLLFTISRSSFAALALGLVVLALARRQRWPLAAAIATVGLGIAFTATFTHFAPRTHFTPTELRQQEANAKRLGGKKATGALSTGEPSFHSHLVNLRDGLRTVAEHPQGYGLGNAGATAARFGVRLKAGESNYTEIGVETGLVGMVLFVAWNLALLAALLRAAWTAADETKRRAAAGVAACLAAVLALAIQTDAYGVPWLGYCLWWLGGALLVPLALRVPALATRAEPSVRAQG